MNKQDWKEEIFDLRVYTKREDWTPIQAALVEIDNLDEDLSRIDQIEEHQGVRQTLLAEMLAEGLEDDPEVNLLKKEIQACEATFPEGFEVVRDEISAVRLARVVNLRGVISSEYPTVPVTMIADDDLEQIAMTLTFNPDSPFTRALLR